MPEPATTDAADQGLPDRWAMISARHDQIDREVDRTRKKNIMNGAFSPEGLVDPGDDIVTCQMPKNALHRNAL